MKWFLQDWQLNVKAMLLICTLTLPKEYQMRSFFKDPEHLNAFYRLGLREKLDEKYHFDVRSLSSYQKGIDFKEINKLYASAGAAAGTLALGGILKFSLASVISIPFAIIIAGAIAVALAAYLKAVPDINKKRFNQAVEKYLDDMEQDILELAD